MEEDALGGFTRGVNGFLRTEDPFLQTEFGPDLPCQSQTGRHEMAEGMRGTAPDPMWDSGKDTGPNDSVGVTAPLWVQGFPV